jgi:hypothetical protein
VKCRLEPIGETQFENHNFLVVLDRTSNFLPISWKYKDSFLKISNPLFRRILFQNFKYKKTLLEIYFFEIYMGFGTEVWLQ